VLDFELPDQDLLDLGDVTLPDPIALSGRVWTNEGKPIPGVQPCDPARRPLR
jgi:hypothetical protein